MRGRKKCGGRIRSISSNVQYCQAHASERIDDHTYHAHGKTRLTHRHLHIK